MRGLAVGVAACLAAVAVSGCSGDTEAKQFQDATIIDACDAMDFVITQTADTLNKPFPYTYADLTNVQLYLGELASIDEAGDGLTEPSTLPGAEDILRYGDSLYEASIDLAVKGLQPDFWQAGVVDDARSSWEMRTALIADRCGEARAQFDSRYGLGS